MIDIDKTRLALDQIAHAKDPLGLVREIVLASGGVYDFVIHQGLATDLNGARSWLKAQGLVADSAAMISAAKASKPVR